MSKKNRVITEGLEEVQADLEVDQMNEVANRIFEGQSPDLPGVERVRRIVIALKAKGYTDMTGLSIPVKELSRLLKKIDA